MERTCIECSNILRGREDQKFCSAECRVAHNNKRNRDSTNYMRNVNNILRKNRRILKDLNPDGKGKTHRDKLVAKGFNFNFFTNTYTTKKGSVYYFCYEQGYLALEKNFYMLVTRTEGVKN